jgi:hypothetical protein
MTSTSWVMGAFAVCVIACALLLLFSWFLMWLESRDD